MCACGGFPGSGVIGFNWGNGPVTNVQLLGRTAAYAVYRTQQNPEVAEIPTAVHSKRGNKQERRRDAALYFRHVSLPNTKQKMEITFVS